MHFNTNLSSSLPLSPTPSSLGSSIQVQGKVHHKLPWICPLQHELAPSKELKHISSGRRSAGTSPTGRGALCRGATIPLSSLPKSPLVSTAACELPMSHRQTNTGKTNLLLLWPHSCFYYWSLMMLKIES